jgi:hypothetical protein
MAQSGYTPISLYYSATANNVPTSANLVSGELAINITDGKLYYKNNGGTVTLLASSANASPVTTFSAGTTGLTPSTATSGAVTLSGVLTTVNGGTGANSLANANIAQFNTAQTWTATQTFNGSSSTEAIKVLNIAEPANVVGSAPSATTNFYVNSGAVQYYTTNAANNWTLNFAFSSGTSLNTAMAVGDSISCTMVTTQGATAYYNSAIQVDGTSSGVTTKWQGGTAPTSGDASAIDSYTYVIIKTASATYTVLASVTKFA